MAEQTTAAKSRLMKVLSIIIFLAALGAAGYYFYRYQDVKKHPDKLTQQEVAGLKKAIAQLIELPANEEPTLATVTDADALKKEQPFFVNAQNGDKVLVYVAAKKAILYRPSTGKLIEVGPVTIEPNSAGTASPTPTPTLTRPPSPRTTTPTTTVSPTT